MRMGVPAALKNVLPPPVVAWNVPMPFNFETAIGGACGESKKNSL
jgi:hypothetical protein